MLAGFICYCVHLGLFSAPVVKITAEAAWGDGVSFSSVQGHMFIFYGGVTVAGS